MTYFVLTPQPDMDHEDARRYTLDTVHNKQQVENLLARAGSSSGIFVIEGQKLNFDIEVKFK